MKRVKAPWTPEQVRSLLFYQGDHTTHEFTCPDGQMLFPKADGWFCPHCDYRQAWAWDYMLAWAPAG